jgi:membrane-bound lytic murein transglycosylase B
MAILRTVAATALAACLLASCSGDDRPPASPPPGRPDASPSAPPTASPVRTPFSDPFAAARSYEVSSPDDLARRLTAAELALRDADDDTDIAEAARVQQAAYRQLVTTPVWRETVYRRLPPSLARDARDNVRAGAELRAITQPRDELPPWRIVSPPSAATLLEAYKHAERSLGVPWEYLAAIHLSETRMGRIRGTSIAGAKGPMQFLPQTWAAYGEGDIEDPDDAILAAARYLSANGAPRDMSQALFAYNHSDHYVRAITLYAKIMQRDARTYHGYHAWQVYYRTTRGDALLYEGWPTK